MSTIDSIPLQFQITAAALSDRDNQFLQNSLSIGLAQYKVLAVLSEKTRATQKEIAYELGQTEASISRQVQNMYDEGLLKSEPKAGDRRVHLTTLTPRGKRVAKRAQVLLKKHNKEMFGALTAAQQKQLGALLETLQKKL